jgi:hypothetical protein
MDKKHTPTQAHPQAARPPKSLNFCHFYEGKYRRRKKKQKVSELLERRNSRERNLNSVASF